MRGEKKRNGMVRHHPKTPNLFSTSGEKQMNGVGC